MNAVITVRPEFSQLYNRQVYVADGPDGHTDLLCRTTPEAAKAAGEEYWARTRAWVDGRWVFI